MPVTALVVRTPPLMAAVPSLLLAMVKAVARPAFGVHLDPCNAVNCPQRFYQSTVLLNECFDKLGPWIVSCHAKDLTWDIEMNVHFREVVPGTGTLDYGTFLRRLAELPGVRIRRGVGDRRGLARDAHRPFVAPGNFPAAGIFSERFIKADVALHDPFDRAAQRLQRQGS